MNVTLLNLRDQSTPDCLSWSCCPEEVRGQRVTGARSQTDTKNQHQFVLLVLLFVTLKDFCVAEEACVIC